MTAIGGLTIRRAGAEDRIALDQLYAAAFPDEELTPLVHALLATDGIHSLAAVQGSQLIGHILFTPGQVAGSSSRLALLGPLAVSPDHQRQGIGSKLIKAGIDARRGEGIDRVLVLGDPAFYHRFGFSKEGGVLPPYPLPQEWAAAWQGLELTTRPAPVGALILAAPWRRRALWAP